MTEEMKVQNHEIRLVRIDPDKPGFMPRYRQMLSARRALSDFDKATPEDVDGIYELIIEHMTFPESRAEKLKIINDLAIKDLAAIFDELMGAKTVPPPKDAA